MLSPRDETAENMITYIDNIRTRYPNVQVLFDPQFFVSTLSPLRSGKLNTYPFFRENLSRRDFITPSSLTNYVQEVIDYQNNNLNITRLISPTVLFDDFNDNWSQIALSLAYESVVFYHSLNNPAPLLVCLAINETALRNSDAMKDFLNVISLMDVKGFYILVRRESTADPFIDSEILESLLYITYILASVNDYEVIFGYTDFLGIPLHAVGLTASACGWFNGLKQFSLTRFQPTSGGRRPLPMYTSGKLLNSILVIPELSSLYGLGLVDEVSSNTPYERELIQNPANAPWTNTSSCLQHWNVIAQVITNIDAFPTITDKLDFVEGLIEQAHTTYSFLQDKLVFRYSSGIHHLNPWRTAIKSFRNYVGE